MAASVCGARRLLRACWAGSRRPPLLPTLVACLLATRALPVTPPYSSRRPPPLAPVARSPAPQRTGGCPIPLSLPPSLAMEREGPTS